jgi:putative DNA primase/helicase
MSRLTLEEAARARTWNLLIAATILGPDVPFQDLEHDRHWDGLGGFSVDRRDGAWWCFGTEEGGYSAVALARFLLKGSAWEDATAWVRSFITAHPGTGPCDSEVAEDDASETRTRISAFRARQIIADRMPIDGSGDTRAERYLRSLGIALPYPLPLYRLPNARAGEEAIVVDLVASGRPVAIQLTYIDALDSRSVHQPDRRRFNLEPYRPDAVIPIARAEPGTVDVAADRIYAEGIEKGLAVYQVKRPGWAITAVPGIGALRHQKPQRPGERVIVFRDGDPEDSPADKALQAGVDALLLAGAAVRTTETPAGESAKSILTDPAKGKKELRRLLAKPVGAVLSFDGKVGELAGFAETQYEKARKDAAKAHGVRVGYLDKKVTEARGRLKPLPSAPAVIEEPPWEGTVDLGQVLDSIVAVAPKFLVAPKHYYDVMALWSAATYLVQSEEIALPIMPQLAFQSAGPESGKSTALEIVATLSCRGRLRSSYTAATVFRGISEHVCTYCLTDLHTVLTDPRSELHQIVKACHRRAEAFVDRTEENSGGKRYIETYRCWAALAWASIGPLFEEMQGRAIILPLSPVLPEESRELDHSSPGRNEVLIDARRQLAAWGPTITAPLDPKIPEPLYSRIADNWRPLVALAELAGGDWPRRVLIAIEELRKVEHKPSFHMRLFTAVRDAFDARARIDSQAARTKAGQPTFTEEELLGITAGPSTRLTTPELLATLNTNEECGLSETNHGRLLTAYWLRDQFRGFPIHSGDWWEGPAGSQKHRSGYYRDQFDDTFRRYRIPLPSMPGSGTGVSGVSGVGPGIASVSAAFATPHAPSASGVSSGVWLATPDDTPHAPAASGVENPAKSAAFTASTLNTPDTLDADGGFGKSTQAKPNGAGAPESRTNPGENADYDGIVTAAEAAETLDLPPPPVPKYQPGAVEAEIRRLHRDNPKRSIAWLGKQTGQPRSVVRIVLQGNGADTGDAR